MLSGTGLEAEIDVTPGSLAFGSQAVLGGQTTSQTVTIENVGTTTLNFTGAGMVLSGADAAEFVITSGVNTSPLPAGATRTVDVAFDPSSAGAKSANLTRAIHHLKSETC